MGYDFWAEIDKNNGVRSVMKGKKFLGEEIDTFQMWKNPTQKESLRKSWEKGGARDTLNAYISEYGSLLDSIDPAKVIIDIEILPVFSWFLQFTFTLKKPFISKDDGELHLYDNPICREKIFRVPMVRPSTWKGNLRFAFRQKWGDTKITEEERLFGNLKGKDDPEEFKRGRLQFFPTFFREINFEVITPLDRERRIPTEKGPIFFEAIKENTKATFTLLYVPFNLIGKGKAPDKLKEEVGKDLALVCEAVKEMMLTYGFSAKKTSGFGVIAPKLEKGRIFFNGISLPDNNFCNFGGLDDKNGLDDKVKTIIAKLGGNNDSN